MPVYEYRCENDHTFEVMQRMSDDPVSTCTVCGAPVQRVFHPVAVHFKGSGFYATDYGRKKTSAGASSDDTGSGSDAGAKKDSAPAASTGDAKSSGGETKSAPAKTESKTESKAESKPAKASSAKKD